MTHGQVTNARNSFSKKEARLRREHHGIEDYGARHFGNKPRTRRLRKPMRRDLLALLRKEAERYRNNMW